jgi:hypothetical protein
LKDKHLAARLALRCVNQIIWSYLCKMGFFFWLSNGLLWGELIISCSWFWQMWMDIFGKNSIHASPISVTKLNFYKCGFVHCSCFNLKWFCMKGTCGNLYFHIEISHNTVMFEICLYLFFDIY